MMKNLSQKLLVVLSLILFISLIGCEKEEEKTTYQIANNFTPLATNTEYLDGTLWEVVVFCYTGTDIVRQDDIALIAPGGGKSEIKEVEPNYEKIKVSFKFLPSQSSNYDMEANHRMYVVAYLMLEKGKNNVITITDNTMVGSTLKGAVIGKSAENSFLNLSK